MARSLTRRTLDEPMVRISPFLSPRPVSSRLRLAVIMASVAALAACSGVTIKPDPQLPKPIIVTMPARVGLILGGDMRNFMHEETRWAVDWKISLGPGHQHLMRDILKDTFDLVQEFPDLESARAAPDLKAIFEPRIEQYSFVTARETGGRYYAVTIRYRINLYTPSGEKADSYTLTGYGNALAKGMSSGKPLELASSAAMRDAAAKFLVQFPTQPAGELLAKNAAVVVEPANAATADAGGIGTVPIDEPVIDARAAIPPASAVPPPAPTPAPPAATPAPKS